MKKLVIATIAMMALGCSQSEVADLGSSEQASTARAPVGQPYTFSVSNPSLYSSFSWTVINSSTGADETSQCTDPAMASITCVFGTTGMRQATAVADRIAGGSATIRKNVDFIDAVNANQAPRIGINVLNATSSGLIAFVDQFDIVLPTVDDELEVDYVSGVALEFYNADETLTTDDSDAPDALTYAVSVAGGPFVAYTSGSRVAGLDTPGSTSISVRVTGNGADVNVVTYDASAAVTAPRGDSVLRCAWDFNADALHDGVGEDDMNWMDCATPVTQVNLFHGRRDLYSLRVLDLTCGIERTHTFQANLNFGKVDVSGFTASSQAEDLYGMDIRFLQADIAPMPTVAFDELAPHQGAELLAIEGNGGNFRRITCDYGAGGSNSTFAIEASYEYEKTGNPSYGMSIELNGIDDALVQAFTPQTISGNLVDTDYWSDKDEDNLSQFNYDMSGACTYEATIESEVVTQDCNGTPIDGVVVKVFGIYDCGTNALTSTGTRAVSANAGAFQCTRAVIDSCPAPPGGNNNNNTPPPRQE